MERIVRLLPGILFLLVLAGGTWLRFFHIGEPSLWIDEGFTLTQANAIALHGYPLLDSGFVEKKDPLLPALLAPFSLEIDAFSPSLPRGAVALFGSAAILIAFFVGSALKDRWTGLVFSLLIAFSSAHIAWSRQIRGYEVAVFFLLLSFLFLLSAIRSKKTIFLGSGSITAGVFATLSKSFGLFAIPAAILGILLEKYRDRDRLVRSLALAVFGLTLGSMFFISASFAPSESDRPLYFLHYLFGALWSPMGILLPLAVLGIFLGIRDASRRSFSIALLFFILSTFLFVSVFVPAQENRYIHLALPALLLFAALAIRTLAGNIPLPLPLGMLLAIGTLFTVDFSTVRWFSLVPQTNIALEPGTPQPPFDQAYRFLETRLLPENTIISPYPFLDRLYLNRSDFALPLSYTGRIEDSSIIRNREYYSGTRSLFAGGNESAERLIATRRKKGTIYIILDSLALRRLDPKHLETIRRNASIVFEASRDDIPGQTVSVLALQRLIPDE